MEEKTRVFRLFCVLGKMATKRKSNILFLKIRPRIQFEWQEIKFFLIFVRKLDVLLLGSKTAADIAA